MGADLACCPQNVSNKKSQTEIYALSPGTQSPAQDNIFNREYMLYDGNESGAQATPEQEVKGELTYNQESLPFQCENILKLKGSSEFHRKNLLELEGKLENEKSIEKEKNGENFRYSYDKDDNKDMVRLNKTQEIKNINENAINPLESSVSIKTHTSPEKRNIFLEKFKIEPVPALDVEEKQDNNKGNEEEEEEGEEEEEEEEKTENKNDDFTKEKISKINNVKNSSDSHELVNSAENVLEEQEKNDAIKNLAEGKNKSMTRLNSNSLSYMQTTNRSNDTNQNNTHKTGDNEQFPIATVKIISPDISYSNVIENNVSKNIENNGQIIQSIDNFNVPINPCINSLDKVLPETTFDPIIMNVETTKEDTINHNIINNKSNNDINNNDDINANNANIVDNTNISNNTKYNINSIYSNITEYPTNYTEINNNINNNDDIFNNVSYDIVDPLLTENTTNIPSTINITNTSNIPNNYNITTNTNTINLPKNLNINNTNVPNITNNLNTLKIPNNFNITNNPNTLNTPNTANNINISNITNTPNPLNMSSTPSPLNITSTPNPLNITNTPNSLTINNTPNSFNITNTPINSNIIPTNANIMSNNIPYNNKPLNYTAMNIPISSLLGNNNIINNNEMNTKIKYNFNNDINYNINSGIINQFTPSTPIITNVQLSRSSSQPMLNLPMYSIPPLSSQQFGFNYIDNKAMPNLTPTIPRTFCYSSVNGYKKGELNNVTEYKGKNWMKKLRMLPNHRNIPSYPANNKYRHRSLSPTFSYKYKNRYKNILSHPEGYTCNARTQTLDPEYLSRRLMALSGTSDDPNFNPNGWREFYPSDDSFFTKSYGITICETRQVKHPDDLNLCEVYRGEVNEKGQRHGFGVLVTRGSVMRGGFRRGKFTGWGRLSKENGDIFECKMIESVPHGKGRYKNMRKGCKYEGEFKAGRLEGKGKIWFIKQGHKYEGDFKNNKICGKGKFTWKNGDIYEGDVVNGKMDGKGKYIYNNGKVYEGEYKNGKKEGKGKLLYEDGRVYENEFKEGKPIGKWKVYMNGEEYEEEEN